MIEGHEVITLRRKEQGTQKLFVDTPKTQAANWGSPVMEENWVGLCQALYTAIGVEGWRNVRETLAEVSKKIGVEKAGQKVAGSGDV